jgi:hypothetical protein
MKQFSAIGLNNVAAFNMSFSAAGLTGMQKWQRIKPRFCVRFIIKSVPKVHMNLNTVLRPRMFASLKKV